MLRTLLKDTTGASALEYAIIASLVSVAAIGAFLALGNQSKANLESVKTAYEQAN
jgi:Flp pilus assembly pilin Flp